MKCKCSSCSSVLYIADEALAKQRKPQFNCPKCDVRILILPKKAKCGKCNSTFGFFSFLLKKGVNIFNCPSCNAKNRILK